MNRIHLSLLILLSAVFVNGDEVLSDADWEAQALASLHRAGEKHPEVLIVDSPFRLRMNFIDEEWGKRGDPRFDDPKKAEILAASVAKIYEKILDAAVVEMEAHFDTFSNQQLASLDLTANRPWLEGLIDFTHLTPEEHAMLTDDLIAEAREWKEVAREVLRENAKVTAEAPEKSTKQLEAEIQGLRAETSRIIAERVEDENRRAQEARDRAQYQSTTTYGRPVSVHSKPSPITRSGTISTPSGSSTYSIDRRGGITIYGRDGATIVD